MSEGVVTGPERARRDLAEVLSGDRVELSEAQARMAQRGHPLGRIDRARRALEVETVREGAPGSRQTFYWQLPTSCPTCSRPFGPVETTASAPWGGNRAGNTDYWQEPHPPNGPVSPEPAPPPPPPPPRYEPPGPPTCDLCGRTSASSSGDRCPWQSFTGQHCQGTMT